MRPPPEPGAGARGARSRFGATAAAAMALVVAAYANSFQNAFQFDDQNVLVGNVFIRSLRNVPRFFADARTYTSHPQNMAYRPLVSTSLALDHALAGGLRPAPFHVSQLALMLALGALLTAFFARVMDRASPRPGNRYLALFAATLFCVHAVNTETMNLMHVRSELLSTIGIVAAFLVYGSGRTVARRWLSLVPVAVGALAKIPAVLFAPLVLAFELLQPPREARGGASARRGRLPAALRAAAPALGAAVVLYVLVERVMRAPTLAYAAGTSAYRYALTQAWAWVHYLRLFFLPLGLTADSDQELLEHWYDTRVLAGALVIVLLAAIVRRTARDPLRWPVAFGVAWFMISLLPASSVLPLAEPVNEHRAFVAHIGLALATAWAARLALDAALERWRAGAGVRTVVPAACCAAVLGAHAVGVHVRNEVWRTDETLWADVTAKSPRNGRAWMNYGVALMARGRWAPARAAFERAGALTPGYPFVDLNLGILDASTGDPAAAERHFRRALELGPGEPTAYDHYARFLVRQGRSPEALPLLERAVQLGPAVEPARALLLDLHAVRGDGDVARLARELLALSPGDAKARAYAAGAWPAQAGADDYASRVRRGLELGARQELVESALAYRAALALDPSGFDALNNLGWTLGKLGFFEQAVPVLERAVRAEPDQRLARNNLEWARQNLK